MSAAELYLIEKPQKGLLVKGACMLLTNIRVRSVRYHNDGSEKLNACISLLSHMVYL